MSYYHLNETPLQTSYCLQVHLLCVQSFLQLHLIIFNNFSGAIDFVISIGIIVLLVFSTPMIMDQYNYFPSKLGSGSNNERGVIQLHQWLVQEILVEQDSF